MRMRAALARHAVWVNLAVVLAILGLAALVPPDGRLAEIRTRGVLRICTPAAGLSEAEADLAQRLADAIPARLSLQPLAAIGADANPRNWRVTRAQCDVIAGGLADTATSRSFLAVVPIGLRTGWAVLPDGLARCRRALVWPGTTGLSRVALSSYLRAEGIAARLAPGLAAAQAALAAGEADCLIAPLPDLQRLPEAGRTGLLAVPGVPAASLGFGIWKGDATLTRLLRKIVSRPAE